MRSPDSDDPATPVWISHRGYRGEAVENTAQAFRAALALGFTHLETDLRTTADGHLVLIHDPDLSRLADVPLTVGQATRAQLEKVRLPGGAHLLFFDQFLAEFSQFHWILDIKPEGAERTIRALEFWWNQPRYADFFRNRVRYLCWTRGQQQLLRASQSDAEFMARVWPCRRAGLACLLGLPGLSGIEPGVTYALPPRLGSWRLMKPAVAACYHKAGGRLLAYLPENDADARLALGAGVDEILTDGPILAA